jgi:cytochrome P450
MSSTEVAPSDLELLAEFPPEVRADPHPLYQRIREQAPILGRDGDVWLLTRYADCEAVLRDPRWSSNPVHMANPPDLQDASVREAMATTGSTILLFMDPPDHTRIRNLVSRNFTPKAIAAWQPRVTAIVDRFLDELAERGEMELISEYAFQIPVTVICEMLGVPAEDRHLFGPWSADASRLLDNDLDSETMMRGLGGAAQLLQYLDPLIVDRQANPRDDLLSAIVHAKEDESRLND